MYNGLETEAREGFEESQPRLLWFRLTEKQDRLSYGADSRTLSVQAMPMH